MSLFSEIRNAKINPSTEEELEINELDCNKSHLCEHQFDDGAFCHMVAPSGEPFCRWHSTADDRMKRRYKYEKRRSKLAIKELIIPCIEDQYSHQLAVHEVMDAIIDGRADSRRAGHLLYALQIAQNNIRGHLHFPRIRFSHANLEEMLLDELEKERKDERDRAANRKKPPQSISAAEVAVITSPSVASE